jgi:hypothetical protein
MTRLESSAWILTGGSAWLCVTGLTCTPTATSTSRGLPTQAVPWCSSSAGWSQPRCTPRSRTRYRAGAARLRASGLSPQIQQRGREMADLAYILLTVAVFALFGLVVKAVERL